MPVENWDTRAALMWVLVARVRPGRAVVCNHEASRSLKNDRISSRAAIVG